MKKYVISVVMLVACGVQVSGQDRQISGTVICSSDSIPLFAVSISMEGTTLGAISGENGEFSMIVPDECPALVFNYVGMKTKQVELGDQKNIDFKVMMEPDVIELAEVTIVYDRLTHLSQCHRTEFKMDTLVKINALVRLDELHPDEFVWNLR